MNSIQSRKLAGNINLLNINSKQFKTSLISIYIKRPLNECEATLNSLIPSILKMGSKNYPTQADISKKLQDLYGSYIGVGVGKLGEKQILSFKLLFTNDKYLNEKVASKAFSVMIDVLLNPLIEDGGFASKYLDIEKDVLKESLLSRINNKGAYAFERCIEHMCKGEPYSINEDGNIEDLDKITPDSLYKHYKKILLESEIDISITGDLDEEFISEIVKLVEDKFSFRNSQTIAIPRENINHKIDQVKHITEEMDVSQGKIILGYRTNVNVKSDQYVPMFLYSIILGSGTNSKLFKNIREKHSLCYSINCFLEKLKGIMFITAGIDTANFEKTVSLIKKEVKNMNEGIISDNELRFAKKFIRNNFESLKDSIWSLSDYYYNLNNQGRNETADEFLGKVEKVSIDDIKKASSNIQLDTIYFLTKKGE